SNSGQLGGSTTDTLTKDGPGTLRVLGQSSRMGTTTLLGGTTRMENGGSLGYGPIIIGNGAALEGSGMSFFGATGFTQMTLQNGSTIRGYGNITANSLQAGSGDVNATIASGTGVADVFSVVLSAAFGGTAASVI